MSSMIQSLESRRLLADFSVAFTSDTIPDSVKAGDKLKAPSATFTVTANGDLDKKTQGKAKLTLDVAITNGATNVTSAKQVKLTASALSKPKAVKAVFSSLKVAPAAGTYTITATLAGDLATGGDTNAANNSASTTFTVGTGSNGGGGSSATPFAGSQYQGNVLKFKKGKAVGGAGLGVEQGTFTDEDGNTGTYQITFGTGVTDQAGFIDPANSAPFTVKFHPNGAPLKSLSGKTFTFGVSESEAKGYVDYAGGKVFYK